MIQRLRLSPFCRTILSRWHPPFHLRTETDPVFERSVFWVIWTETRKAVLTCVNRGPSQARGSRLQSGRSDSSANQNKNLHIVYIWYQFVIIKPTTFTNFSNLFLEWNSTCFGQFLCPSSWVFFTVHIAMVHVITLRTRSFKLFKRPFPGFLTILTF